MEEWWAASEWTSKGMTKRNRSVVSSLFRVPKWSPNGSITPSSTPWTAQAEHPSSQKTANKMATIYCVFVVPVSCKAGRIVPEWPCCYLRLRSERNGREVAQQNVFDMSCLYDFWRRKWGKRAVLYSKSHRDERGRVLIKWVRYVVSSLFWVSMVGQNDTKLGR